MEIRQIRMHVENAGGLRECVVVDAAPLASMASELMIDMWKDGLARHLEVKGDRITFGTEGVGLGVVAYDIGPRIPDDQLPPARRARPTSRAVSSAPGSTARPGPGRRETPRTSAPAASR